MTMMRTTTRQAKPETFSSSLSGLWYSLSSSCESTPDGSGIGPRGGT